MIAQQQYCSRDSDVAVDRSRPREDDGDSIEVVDYQSTDAGEWKRFLENSSNGTLFHDQDFLAYHDPDRFAFRHLMFRRDGRMIALLPGGLIQDAEGRPAYHSPCGASVGGFVLPQRLGLVAMRQLVARLKQHAVQRGWDGIEMRLGPSVYLRDQDDQLGFCLAAEGFRLIRRWLTHVVPCPAQTELVETLLPKRKRDYVRAAERKGACVREASADELEAFYNVLLANRSRHGAKPTHTLEELQTLMKLIPSAVRLFLCKVGEAVAGGALVFELNERVAYNFYPCHNEAYTDLRPALLVGVRVIEHYMRRGFRYLDLGPSTFDDYVLNDGLTSFKESLGARGYCRDSWRWSVCQKV
jgi:hypothetical protein